MSKRKPKIDWTGQVGMDIGERRKRAELEADVLKRVRTALETVGVMVERQQVGTFKTMHGTYIKIGTEGDPDLRCSMWPAVVFYVETKRGSGGIITDEQHARVAELRRLGFVAGFATSPEEALALWTLAKKARAA